MHTDKSMYRASNYTSCSIPMYDTTKAAEAMHVLYTPVPSVRCPCLPPPPASCGRSTAAAAGRALPPVLPAPASAPHLHARHSTARQGQPCKCMRSASSAARSFFSAARAGHSTMHAGHEHKSPTSPNALNILKLGAADSVLALTNMACG